jgi:DNA-binding MarR family transcriptional regulator
VHIRDDLAAASVRELIPLLCRSHHEQIRVMFHDMGLHRGQNFVLHHLWMEDGLTISELADEMQLRPPTVSRMLQRMEKSGWIVRRSDPEDARVSRVFLTEAGRQVQGQVLDAEQRLGEMALRGFTAEEQMLLRRFLVQLVSNLLPGDGPEK